MFLVNSRLGLDIATFKKVPFLPKLQGQFAEFLRESSLAPLGLLNHPTCVGFWYRFLKTHDILLFLDNANFIINTTLL